MILITFSIISRIVFVEHSVLIIASEAANGPLVCYYSVILSSPLEGSQARNEADI